MPPKAKLVVSLSDAAKATTSKPVKQSAVARRTSDEAIQRQIEEHFPEKSYEETDLLKVNNKTLRATLKELREAHGGQGRLGPSQLAEFRDKFTSPDAIAKKLRVTSETDALSEELLVAMVQADCVNRAKRTREPMYAYLESCVTISQRELIGILKHLTNVNVVYPAGRAHALRVLKHLVDKDCLTKYPAEMKLLGVKWDEVLAGTYSLARKHTSMARWWEENSVYAAALPYYDVLARVLNADAGLADLADDVQYLTSHTQLGKRMCEKAHAFITIEEYSKKLQDELANLNAKPLTEQTLTEFKAVAERLINATGDLKNDVTKRFIDVSYRGTMVKMEVTGLRMELTRRLGALVKERALMIKSGLKELEWERHLFAAVTQIDEPLDGKYIRKFSAARVAAEELVPQGEAWTAKQILEKYQQKREYLIEKDATFDVEIAILEWMVAEGGRQAVERKVLSFMPSASQDVSLQETLSKLGEFKEHPLMSLLGPSETALVALAEETVFKHQRGVPPNAALFASPGFHTDFYSRFPWFLKVTVTDGQRQKTLRGEAARKHLVKTRLADGYECQGYGDLSDLKLYEYLCSAQEQKQIRAAIDKLRAGDVQKPTTPPASRKRASDTAAKEGKKQKASAESDARKAALALFKN